MHQIGERIVISATDLSRASACELGLLRQLDVMLGRLPRTEAAPDAMLDQLASES